MKVELIREKMNISRKEFAEKILCMSADRYESILVSNQCTLEDLDWIVEKLLKNAAIPTYQIFSDGTNDDKIDAIAAGALVLSNLDPESEEMEEFGLLKIMPLTYFANLTDGKYDIINYRYPEGYYKSGENREISDAVEILCKMGKIHPDDADNFFTFMQLDHLRDCLKRKNKISHIYCRKVGDIWQWLTMTIQRTMEYTNENQKVFVYIERTYDGYE